MRVYERHVLFLWFFMLLHKSNFSVIFKRQKRSRQTSEKHSQAFVFLNIFAMDFHLTHPIANLQTEQNQLSFLLSSCILPEKASQTLKVMHITIL